MNLKILRGSDEAPLTPLMHRTVAVLGYGNQGRAHASNLRDSGVRVIVANRANSPGWRLAAHDGFEPREIEEAVALADLVIVALPDEAQSRVYRERIAQHLKPGATLGFIHGFNIHFGLIEPTKGAGTVMIAPKGPGTTLRERFEQGLGIPCLFALHQESARSDAASLALAWANGIGCARAGIIHTTFKDETETDLFGEQAVLCGGMTQLILSAFEILVETGYPPELAYLECCHEVKQIADLVYREGLAGMMRSISNTAEFGAHVAGPKLIDDAVKQRMGDLLNDIKSGAFAKRLGEDYARGFPWFEGRRAALRDHPIEPAGSVIRSLMSSSDLGQGSSQGDPH